MINDLYTKPLMMFTIQDLMWIFLVQFSLIVIAVIIYVIVNIISEYRRRKINEYR